MTPKPLEQELSKALKQRSKWRNRREICCKKLREIQKRIELLDFQREVSESKVSIPCRTIKMPGDVDWGIFWKDVPLSTLPISKIKGIGISKAKSLIAAFSSVGELESWRLSRGFTSIPGFNRFASSNLEEMFLRWLRTYAPEYRIPASADSLPLQAKQSGSNDGTLWLE